VVVLASFMLVNMLLARRYVKAATIVKLCNMLSLAYGLGARTGKVSLLEITSSPLYFTF